MSFVGEPSFQAEGTEHHHLFLVPDEESKIKAEENLESARVRTEEAGTPRDQQHPVKVLVLGADNFTELSGQTEGAVFVPCTLAPQIERFIAAKRASSN